MARINSGPRFDDGSLVKDLTISGLGSYDQFSTATNEKEREFLGLVLAATKSAYEVVINESRATPPYVANCCVISEQLKSKLDEVLAKECPGDYEVKLSDFDHSEPHQYVLVYSKAHQKPIWLVDANYKQVLLATSFSKDEMAKLPDVLVVKLGSGNLQKSLAKHRIQASYHHYWSEALKLDDG